MRRHINTRPRLNRILRPPQTSHSLLLRIKRQPWLPIKRIRTPTRNTLLIPCKAKHGQRHGNRHIDSNLACLEILLEAGSGGTGAGEDCGAVTVFVGVDEGDGVVGGVDV